MRPLLAVDGDSFAHRAYHSVPKSVNRNAIVGFTNMMIGLWEQTQPRAVVVGWDTLEVPTYRHEAFAGYQAGRVFDKSLLDQLGMLPELCSALDFAVGKAPGYEADDFLAASVASEEGRGGMTLVASGDRDTFQLVSARTTVLQPIRGVSEIARIGPAEVRERYGVEPTQVPDFIALRGDPSDKLPGAKGVGPKTAASLLAQYDSLEAMLEEGRFSAQAEELRLYKRIASMDAEAPLPELPDARPDWEAGAKLARSWGLNALADRLEGRAQSTS